jgi:hypothetical protein
MVFFSQSKIMFNKTVVCIFFALSQNSIASTLSNSYFFTAAAGFSQYNGFENNSGDGGLISASFGKNMFQFGRWIIGSEVGAQTGTHGRAFINDSAKENLGGTAVQLTINPTINANIRVLIPSDNARIGPYFKLGFSYWNITTDRDTVKDRSTVTGTFEGGINIPVNNNLGLEIGYQESFSPNFEIKVEGVGCDGTGVIFGAPKRRSLMLSAVYRTDAS